MALQGIKDIFPYLPSEMKDYVSSRRLKELESLLAISTSQRRLPVSKLRSLIGKLRSMHLSVPVAIGHFFYIHEALTKVGTATKAYISNDFH